MNKKRRKEQTKLKVVFKEAKGVSEEEKQRRLDAAFDILFANYSEKL
tara:strand:+ start:425 stop:565 length:141 start_codon:yes stop_codon:yes gene_type:complete